MSTSLRFCLYVARRCQSISYLIRSDVETPPGASSFYWKGVQPTTKQTECSFAVAGDEKHIT